MKKPTFLLSLIISISLYCNGQITWEKLFVKSNTDVFRCVQEVPSGGYIAAGYTSHWSNNDTDAFVVRLNVNGDTIWTFTLDGGRKDVLYKVINTSDGGFVMCGYKTVGTALSDAYYLKLDANGNLVWQFTYGGTGTERAQDIIQTSDGGYAMCGYTNSGTGAQGYNAFLVKIDAAGGQTWSKKYGTLTFDDANSLKQLADDGFILAGQTVVNTPQLAGEIYLIRTNLIGDTIWTKAIGCGVLNKNENAEYIQISNPGFIIAGSTDSTGSDDGYLVRIDTGGVMQWSRRFGGSSPDDFHRVERTTDSGYIVTGTSQSNAAIISNQWLVKTDSNGDSTWAYTYGGANHDHAYSGVQTSDGGYILCGYTASFGFNYEDGLIIKVDGNGLIYNHLFYTIATALVTPQNNTCGSTSSVVTITVRNFGDTAVNSIPDTVVITGALTQTLGQTFVGNLNAQDLTNHTFTATINTSAGGTFHFHCFTSTNNDVYPAMNSCDSSITLLGVPTPPTTVNDTSCGQGSLTLTSSSAYTIDWFSTSSGGTSFFQGSSYTTPVLTNTTTYYVQATNACGTSTRTPVTAVIIPVSTAPNVFPAQRCGPGTVTLTAIAADTISWWNQPTGDTLLLFNSGTYIPNVTGTTIFYVQAGTVCPSNRIAITATVNPLPTASFTPSATAVCLGDAFQFTNNSTGATSYFWDFGDATGTSTQTSPTYTYSATASYIVQLVAATDSNCYDTTTVTVGVNTAPVVSFSTATTTGCAPFTVSFTNTTTNASDYLWNFGDGFTSTDAAPIHDYNSVGTFTVTLLATVGSCADSDSVVGMITVYAPPVIDLGPDISTNSITYLLDAGTGFATYLWNNNATTQTITAYTNGVYCVTVTDNNMCSDSDCVNVVLDAMSVEENSGNDVMIYPNPAKDWITIQSLQLTAGNLLKIVDVTGKEILSTELTTSNFRLQISTIESGIYFVEIQSGDKNIRRKLIVN